MAEVQKLQGNTATQPVADVVKKKVEKKESTSLWGGIVADTKELFGLSATDTKPTVEKFLEITNLSNFEGQPDKEQLTKDTLLQCAEIKDDKVYFPACIAAGETNTPEMSLQEAKIYADMVGLKYDADSKKFTEKNWWNKTVDVVTDTVDTVGTVTGLKQMKQSLDEKDQVVELMHKDTTTIKGTEVPTGYGIVSLVGQAASQPTDVLSAATERITLDKTQETLAEKTAHSQDESDMTKALKDLVSSSTAAVKIHNGFWNAVGGISDLGSACLKLEKYTNNKIDEKTKAALAELANRATDLSLDNVNDMLTAYAVTVRLEKTAAKLKEMSDEDIQKALKDEQATFNDVKNGIMNRATIVRGAADKTAEKLISVYSAYLTNQGENGLSKLDNAQITLREGVTDLANAPASLCNVVSASIKTVTKDVPVAKNAGDVVSGAIDAVSGTWEGVTTLIDGKENSTSNAWKKAGNGLLKTVTLGFFGKDNTEEEVISSEAFPATKEKDFNATKGKEYKENYEEARREAYKLPSVWTAKKEIAANQAYEKKLAELEKEDKEAAEAYAKNKKEEIAKLLTTVTPIDNTTVDVSTFEKNAGDEVAKLEKENGGAAEVYTTDVDRLATRAVNATSWGTEFQNQMDVTYSNADNPDKNGELGAGEIGYRFIKGAVMEPLRFFYNNGVTTADKIGIGSLCHISAAVVSGANAVDRAVDGVKTYANNPQNTAATQKAVERGGGAAFWATSSALFGTLMDGNLILCNPGSSSSTKTPCNILEEEPWNFILSWFSK